MKRLFLMLAMGIFTLVLPFSLATSGEVWAADKSEKNIEKLNKAKNNYNKNKMSSDYKKNGKNKLEKVKKA